MPNAIANATTLQRTLHFEQENFMLRVSDAEMKPGEEPDVWQWAKLTPIDPKPFSFDFDLPDLDARGARTAAFTFNFRGMSNVPAKPNETKVADHLDRDQHQRQNARAAELGRPQRIQENARRAARHR